MLKLSKEAKQKLKEMKIQLAYEEKKKKELLGRNTDYSFIQELLDKIDNNPNLTVEIILKNGDRILMKTKETKYSYNEQINGEPSYLEIR